MLCAETASIEPTNHAALCAAHIGWARGYLGKRLGPWATEYAGIGLFEAAKTYDPNRCDSFKAWATQVLVWTAKRAVRRDSRGAAPEQWELLDGDVEASVPSMVSHGLETREQMIGCLRLIEAMPAPARWVVLSRFLADYSNAEIAHVLGRHEKTIPRLLAESRRAGGDSPTLDDVLITSDQRFGGTTRSRATFQSLDDLADALMLFGGAIAQPSSASGAIARVAIGRSRSRWPALVWAMIITERNGLALRGTTMGDTNMVYRSVGTPLLMGAMRRWYGDGTARKVPESLVLDEAKLAFWIVDALSRRPNGPVRFAKPPMLISAAKSMANQIRKIVGCRTATVEVGGGWAVDVPADDRAALEDFVKPLTFPRCWQSAISD